MQTKLNRTTHDYKDIMLEMQEEFSTVGKIVSCEECHLIVPIDKIVCDCGVAFNVRRGGCAINVVQRTDIVFRLAHIFTAGMSNKLHSDTATKSSVVLTADDIVSCTKCDRGRKPDGIACECAYWYNKPVDSPGGSAGVDDNEYDGYYDPSDICDLNPYLTESPYTMARIYAPDVQQQHAAVKARKFD
ncbi:hypothetical protein SARC_10047 [Sphaeroforma arctica JP610]|uniref:Uncharacterized protein n=1 Tax=Sphaeroforma arctica JP610 TaxID=667725 RepID=A0A0L0FLZ0_9EUKA|nr:hypothetical protein SARC_10047 [Sphaeroforma arctica JP610]KNC77496.1 hypothetical protein SARC_10047 [Sphaeroforma arctica JP610]|eukprot:XP_014151398.1 hypothetical protein SARC_10047 [Sphaeroforma arctica JP610]